jgi:hypothetical protein
MIPLYESLQDNERVELLTSEINKLTEMLEVRIKERRKLVYKYDKVRIDFSKKEKPSKK